MLTPSPAPPASRQRLPARRNVVWCQNPPPAPASRGFSAMHPVPLPHEPGLPLPAPGLRLPGEPRGVHLPAAVVCEGDRPSAAVAVLRFAPLQALPARRPGHGRLPGEGGDRVHRRDRCPDLRLRRLAERIAQAVEHHRLDTGVEERSGNGPAHVREGAVAARAPDRAGRALQVHQSAPVGGRELALGVAVGVQMRRADTAFDRVRGQVGGVVDTLQDLLHGQGVAEVVFHHCQPAADQRGGIRRPVPCTRPSSGQHQIREGVRTGVRDPHARSRCGEAPLGGQPAPVRETGQPVGPAGGDDGDPAPAHFPAAVPQRQRRIEAGAGRIERARGAARVGGARASGTVAVARRRHENRPCGPPDAVDQGGEPSFHVRALRQVLLGEGIDPEAHVDDAGPRAQCSIQPGAHNLRVTMDRSAGGGRRGVDRRAGPERDAVHVEMRTVRDTVEVLVILRRQDQAAHRGPVAGPPPSPGVRVGFGSRARQGGVRQAPGSLGRCDFGMGDVDAGVDDRDPLPRPRKRPGAVPRFQPCVGVRRLHRFQRPVPVAVAVVSTVAPVLRIGREHPRPRRPGVGGRPGHARSRIAHYRGVPTTGEGGRTHVPPTAATATATARQRACRDRGEHDSDPLLRHGVHLRRSAFDRGVHRCSSAAGEPATEEWGKLFQRTAVHASRPTRRARSMRPAPL